MDANSTDINMQTGSACYNINVTMRMVEHKFRPTIGAVFASLEAGIKFYEVYARACGFTPRKHSTKTLQGGVAHQKFVVCNRQGFREYKPKQRHRTKDDENMGDAMIDEFYEVHNHRLTSVCNRDLDKISRSLDMFQKTLILDNSKLNIGAGLTFRQVKELVNGYENIGATLIDFKNFQRDIKCYIGLRDADLFIDRLEKLKATQPQFYFAYDVDPQNRLTKFFWADATCSKLLWTSSAIHEGAMIITNDHSFPELKTELPIEKHGAIIYTHAVFKVFQEEVMAADSCGVDDFEKEEHVRIIHVIDAETDRIFKVRFDLRSTDAVCECKLFERIGLLCRHIVWVYKGKGIGRIPSKLDSNGNVIEDSYMATSITSFVQRMVEFRRIVGVLKTLPAEHTEELASLLVEFRQKLCIEPLTKDQEMEIHWAAARRPKSLSTLRNKHATRARKRLKSLNNRPLKKRKAKEAMCILCKERVTHDGEHALFA
ncbi:uncharacterized protein LOC141649236 [Silene latifolia]|uniref:uncharacterized protein LOC141649236 n=1 Tax=Silene latifolia TaxID=37657 RepID=UPI003D7864CA